MANSRTPSDEITKEGFGIHARRAIAYIFLILITILCLFWFYVLFVNATRTHSEIQLGFHALPGTNFLKNFDNTIIHGSQPVWNGLINSVVIAAFSALLTTYFSTMTAYALHVYTFKLKKFMHTFILMIMMIPTQGYRSWFPAVSDKDGVDEQLYSIDRTGCGFTGNLFLHEAVYGIFTAD